MKLSTCWHKHYRLNRKAQVDDWEQAVINAGFAAMLFIALGLLVFALFVAGPAHAETSSQSGPRIGLGQDTAKEPAMLRNLRLTDPLVQRKYLNEPDMLRFLRGTYSEACARGILVTAATEIKLDPQHKYDSAMRDTFRKLLDSQRLWKMPSFELETVFGPAYLKSANYCDCIMKEVADVDLVNPRKGLEVIEKIPQAVQTSCDRIAEEKTARQAGTAKLKE